MHSSSARSIETEYEQQRDVETGVLLEQIYAALFRCLEEAETLHLDGRLVSSRELLRRSVQIITGLRASLAIGHSPQVTRDLDHLYGFCIDSLARAQREDDLECLRDVARILSPLREAWAAANRYDTLLAG